MPEFDRRTLLEAVCAGLALSLAPSLARAADALHLGPGEPFSFEALIERARGMAAQAYAPPPRPDPAIVQRIDYDAYGKIRYRPENAIYRDGPGAYPITLMHVGQYFPKTVRMHVVEGGAAREILYNPGLFDMPVDHVARGLGAEPSAFAGFWMRESRLEGDWAAREPFATFTGATYFRAVGELGQVGMSARGITLNPGEPTPEEFPDFTEFWFEPAPDEQAPTTVLALMDGPSISGAYRFAISRTKGVVMEIEKHLFLRSDVNRVGIAPLTTMFWYGEQNRRYQEDWRPEVHDSDGLALWTGSGERLWRPLNNPNRVVTSSFSDTNPRGFGISQRDRNFDHYLDGVGYDRRPSTWIEPLGDWGRGVVQLVEIPTDDEIYDNVVAFWLPEKPSRAGDALSFRYRLHWLAEEPYWPGDLARIVATRVGRGGEPGKPRPPGKEKFVVELQGPVLEELWGWKLRALADVTASRGTLSLVNLEPVPDQSRRWRVVFDLDAPGLEPVELRMYVRAGDRALSETWLYQHIPATVA